MTEKSILCLIYSRTTAETLILEHMELDSAFLYEKFNHKKPVFVYQYPLFNNTPNNPHNSSLPKGKFYGTRQAGFI